MILSSLGRTTVAVLVLAGACFAQPNSNYQNRCQQETANRLRVNQRDVFTNMQGLSNGRARVNWTVRGRDGYCIIDNRMNVVDFQESNNNGRGGKGGGNPPPVNVPRVRADTDGRGNYNDGRSVRITRGWVDTTGQPAVSLSGDNKFKITFWGDITQGNGREFTMRITRSDTGGANGTATFRLNGDRNEVEYINLNGRINNRNFSGSFNR